MPTESDEVLGHMQVAVDGRHELLRSEEHMEFFRIEQQDWFGLGWLNGARQSHTITVSPVSDQLATGSNGITQPVEIEHAIGCSCLPPLYHERLMVE